MTNGPTPDTVHPIPGTNRSGQFRTQIDALRAAA
jgi:hypothetical protein